MTDMSGQKYLFSTPCGGKNALPTLADIQVAAKVAIEAVKSDFHGATDAVLAAMIGAKDGDVIQRLENLSTQKVPAMLFIAISANYGPQYVRHYTDMFGVDDAGGEVGQALAALTSLTAKLAGALAGGKADLPHQDLLGMESDLRAADAVISLLRRRAEKLRA